MSPKHARPEPPEGQVPAPAPGAAPASAAVERDPAPGPAPASAAVERDPAPGAEQLDPAVPQDREEPGPAATPDLPRGRGPRLPRVRSRWMWALLAVLGVTLLGWVVVSLVVPGGGRSPSPSASPTAEASQDTLLIQVRNDADLGADNMVVGVGADLPAAQVLVPSRLIVDVPGAGQQSLAQSALQLDRTASQDALSDLLAVRIDGTLSLGRLALAGMVDYVGGITVDVDEAVTQTDPKTGETTVVVPKGTQLLDGTQAAAYALSWLPDEPEAARLARFSTVMSATVAALPEDQLRVEQMLTSLGGSARTTSSTGDVARVLLEMREGILAGGQQVRVLPTTDIEAGSGLSVVRVDLPASEELLRTLLPTALLPSDESTPRVLVQNGVGTPGLGASARDQIVGAGMVYINGGNAQSFGQPTTAVIVKDGSEESQQLGVRVADALGVPRSAVTVAAEGQNVADVVVVLGADYEP